MARQPPRLARLLLRILPNPAREFVRGDLEEEYSERLLSERGWVRANLWFWGQTVRSLLSFIGFRPSERSIHAPSPGGPLRLDAMAHDLRLASRNLVRRPGFTLVAVLTLGLGIGANTAIFSVVHGILLSPLPYHEPNRLVDLAVAAGSGTDKLEFYGLSDPEYADLRALANSFERIAGYHGGEVTIGDSLSARRIPVMRVTGDLFPMLGVTPHLGRYFTPEEDTRFGSRAIVLSYGMWQQEFGGDPGIIGRTIMLRDLDAAFAAPFNQSVPVVGVMPSGFKFPESHWEDWEAWVPFGFDLVEPVSRNTHYIEVAARLRPGASLKSAQSEMDVLSARLATEYPEFYSADGGLTIRVQPYHARIVGDVAGPLLLLMGAVGFVLLTACVNIANLLLSHGETRRREMAIRTAMGATRGTAVRLLGTEYFLLAVLGGLFGLAMAFGGARGLLALAPSTLPRLGEVGLDRTVFGFSALLTLGVGLAFGLMPAIQSSKTNVFGVLTDSGGARGATQSGHQTRRILITCQVVFATVLVTGAGLMLRSIRSVYTTDPGFRTENVLVFRLDPAADRYRDPESRIQYYSELLEQLGSVPEVTTVAAVHSPPFGYAGVDLSIEIEGRPAGSIGEAPTSRVQFVTPEYLSTLDLTLTRGRFFTAQDDASAPPVVVVTEAMAAEHWPGENPIGKRIRMYGHQWVEIVGVLGDVYHFGVHRDPGSWWYVPHAQGHLSAYAAPRVMHIAVRSEVDPTTLVRPLRQAVATFDPSAPISRVRTLDEGFAAAVDRERFVTFLLSAFAVVTLFLALVGVQGVISLSVARRTKELGIRIALGAEARSVFLLVIREGLVLSLSGVVVGTMGSLLLSSALETLVFGITPTDPGTYLGVSILLTTASVIAAVFPARRATRMDPVVALRTE